MEENDKHKLEGLLKARSQDLRQGRGTRTRRPVADGMPVSAAPTGAREAAGAARRCADCGGDISARRLRAMPRATLCLGCQRAAEAAVAHS